MASVTHFFAPSRDLRDRFVAAGLDPARISLCDPGVAPLQIDRKPIRVAAARERLPIRIGFLGSLMISKAPHLLIEACESLGKDSVEVRVFGDHAGYHGDAGYRDRLTPLLNRSFVRHHGKIARDTLAGALEQIDVLVVPSIWPENSPFVIREAFLAGVPVVASRIGGIPELIVDGVNGLLFEAGNVGELARTLRRLVDEPDLLPKLRAGIPAVTSIDDDARSLCAAYAHALNTPRAETRLAAVVLNYRTAEQTFFATRSLLLSRRPVDRIIVVDNSDTDDCREVLRPFLDRITYVRTGANLGFSGGMNTGIRKALAGGADAVLLVNSDVIVPADCIGTLERALAADRAAGIAGPVVLARSRPDTVASLGISYNERTGRMRHRGFGAGLHAVPRAAIVNADGVSGCLMLVRKEVFAAIGMLDEQYFFSFEDLDFCRRAADAGFTTVVGTRAAVLHQGGQSMGADSPRRFYFATRNHLLLTRERRGSPAFVLMLNVAHALRASGGSIFLRLGAVARGARDFLGGRFGPGAQVPHLGAEDGRLLDQPLDLPALPGQDQRQPQKREHDDRREGDEDDVRWVVDAQLARGGVEQLAPDRHGQ